MPEKTILTQWHKPDGSRVAAGDILCTIETDQASQEIESPEAGILRHLKQEGDSLAINDPPLRIDPLP
jgi:pyruvate/2-oxoglutarate dehydrogenase complex dihydrolipoamide acyltransferase (E2) component